MAWIDILKSLLYDGEHTFGITIWFLMVLCCILFVLFYYMSKYRVAFGRRRLLRRIIAKNSVKTGVKFDIKGEVSDRVLFNVVEESFLMAIGEFDKEVGINE